MNPPSEFSGPLRPILSSFRSTASEIRDGFRSVVGAPKYGMRDLDYNKYWEARDLAGVQPRYPIVADHIEPGTSVLDVGCGDGGMLRYLKDRKPGLRELGIDVSTVAVQRARDRGVNARTTTLESVAERHPDGGSYDYVIMSEVLEHLSEPERFVRLGWKLTRRGLILTFPNIAYWPHRLRLLLGRFPVQWVHHPGEHLRFWSVRDFGEWLSRLALSETRQVQTTYCASNGLTLFGIHRLCPNLFGNQIVVAVGDGDSPDG